MSKIKTLIDNYKQISLDEFKTGNIDCLTAIINAQVLNPCENNIEADILIYKDKIIGVNADILELPENVHSVHVIDAKGLTVTPGLIDQHIHGGYDCDFNRSSAAEMLYFAAQLPKHGITSVVPTIMTDSEDKIKTQIKTVKEAKKQLPENSTKFQGIHLEGPCLNKKCKGIHPEQVILSPTIDNYKKIEDEEVKIFSFAPEFDENFELTHYLTKKGVVASAAHTNSTSEEIKKANANGLSMVTHLFNAMPSLHHRTPGIIGEALTNDNISVELIADCAHVHPTVINLTLRSKPDSKVIFISDSLPLNNSKHDSLMFGGQEIFKKGDKAVNADGVMAGSLMFLDSIFRTLHSENILNLSKFLQYASANPAANLGLQNYGRIKPGNIADIVFWDENRNYDIKMTTINGKIAYIR